MPFLYKKFFEQVPQNNITEFKATEGVNQIQFLIPAVNGATLSTQDLMFSGNLQVNRDATTPYQNADINVPDQDGISADSVLGLHNIIDRVDIISSRGNTLIEQRLNYQLITKYQRGVQSAQNLNNGRFNHQQLCCESVLGTRNLLTRNALADDGQDFAVQLNTGIMKDNNQVLNLGAMGGLIVKIYLSEPINAFFNIDPAAGTSETIEAGFTYTLRNIKLFGRYNYMTPDSIQALSGISYRKTDNLMSVIQSSNDNLTNSPQVNSLHKMIYVYQPNKFTSNNADRNNMATDMLIDMNEYLLSMNGVRMPLDYSVTVNPSLSQLPANSGEDNKVPGNAEQQYLAISALNDQYPPTHSLSNAENQAAAVNNYFKDENNSTLNVNVIGMNYSFNFDGYTVAVPNDLMSINVESGINTSNANLPDGSAGVDGNNSVDVRGQPATQNLFIEYGAQLNYANMAQMR